MGRGCSSGRVCSLGSSLFPSSRHHGPLLLHSSGSSPAAQPYSLQVFLPPPFFSSLQSCDMSSRLPRCAVVPCDLCPPPISVAAAAAWLRPSPPVLRMCRSSSSVGCHAALLLPPFWFIGHKSRNFFVCFLFFYVKAGKGYSATSCFRECVARVLRFAHARCFEGRGCGSVC